MTLETIAAKELDWYIEDGGYWIIDLRSEEEYQERHIKGAVNIPQGELKPGRSMAMARKLAEKGYHVMSVVGGIRAYRGKYLVA